MLDSGKRRVAVGVPQLLDQLADSLIDADAVILEEPGDARIDDLVGRSGVAVVLRFDADIQRPSMPTMIFHTTGQSLIDTPGGFPVAPPGHIPYYDAAMAGVFAFLALRWDSAADRGSEPLSIRIATEDVELAHGRPDLTRAANEEGARERDPFLALFLRCGDGEIATHINRQYWAEWAELIGQPNLDTDPRFKTMSDLLDNQAQAVAELEKWCAQRTRQEIEALCQKRGIPAGSVLSPEEVVHDAQLVHRGFIDSSGRPAVLPFILADGGRWRSAATTQSVASSGVGS
jgi:crotonobetainyl-CoA:carnitine CoA-transferase CaiB-like acyl-CoA transferase